MFQEYKAFIARGNVLDLAVAVIIGAAFAKITSSLAEDIIMPIIGAVFGGLDFTSHFVLLGPVPDGYRGSLADYAALKAAGAPLLGWGQFLTVVIDFLILAFIIFLLMRWAVRLMGQSAEAASEPTQAELLTEIRDELRKR